MGAMDSSRELTNPSRGLVYGRVNTPYGFGTIASALAVLSLGCAVPELPRDPHKKSFFAEVYFSTASDGSVVDVKILRTDAPASLRSWTISTVRKWRFKPGPAASATRIIRFELNDQQKENPYHRDDPQ